VFESYGSHVSLSFSRANTIFAKATLDCPHKFHYSGAWPTNEGKFAMGAHAATIAISGDTYAAAERIASLDHVTVDVLIESLVKRHAEYIDSLNNFPEMPKFSLDEYEMQRDQGETEEEYQTRLDLFR